MVQNDEKPVKKCKNKKEMEKKKEKKFVEQKSSSKIFKIVYSLDNYCIGHGEISKNM